MGHSWTLHASEWQDCHTGARFTRSSLSEAPQFLFHRRNTYNHFDPHCRDNHVNRQSRTGSPVFPAKLSHLPPDKTYWTHRSGRLRKLSNAVNRML
jgi:hypothetical protein